jgi:hypothetical protein
MDVGTRFRADDGFIPQVGYREVYLNAGYTVRPAQAFLSRLRWFTEDYYDAETDGRPLNQHLALGSDMDGRWNTTCRAELILENVRVGDAWLHRFRPHVLVQASPGRVLNQLSIETNFGQEIDFDNVREGDGLNVVTSVTVRPSEHLELVGNADRRTLNVDAARVPGRRVFTAQVERLRATWSFTSRAFVRLIGQYVETRNDTALYAFPIAPREADFSSSALFAYKLNWQTVFYAGYGDTRTYFGGRDRLVPGEREAFAKVSYALQH